MNAKKSNFGIWFCVIKTIDMLESISDKIFRKTKLIYQLFWYYKLESDQKLQDSRKSIILILCIMTAPIL